MAADTRMTAVLLGIAVCLGTLGTLLGGGVSAQSTGANNITTADSVDMPDRIDDAGIAWYDDRVWFVESVSSPATITEVDPTTGDPLNSITISQANSVQDIAAGDGSLWVLNTPYDGPSEIYQVSPSNGEIQKTLPAPAEATALSIDDGNIWIADNYYITEIDSDNGREYTNITRPRDLAIPEDMDWGDGFLWFAGSRTLTQIDISNSTATVANEYQPSSRYGLSTLAWDGDYMWTGRGSNSTLVRYNLGDVGTPNTPPNISFSATTSASSTGNEVTFDASSSMDSEGYIQTFEWDFDGDSVSDAQGRQVTHPFPSPGEYRVELTATDNDGAVTKLNQTVNVSATTPTQTPTTVRTTAAAETEPPVYTTATQDTLASTQSSTPTQQRQSITQQPTSSTTSLAANSANEETAVQRGFFNNGADAAPSSGLSDPIIITLAGVALTALSIVIQLFREG